MQFKETLIAAILIIAVLFALIIFGAKLPDPIHDLAPVLIIICFVLLGLVVVFYIIQKILAVKSAMAIEKKLKAQASEQISGARPDRQPELQALESQLSEALAALKSSKMGKGALYSLPWYMIIGPPGSGKTTALLESGLNFPYTSGGGRGIKGVGGTRNCDWWFTDQGILLDTAGRYTTELEDRDEWVGFLNMLKKCRNEKPINGVIVAISISDLINATEEEMEAHSKNIRDRVDELSKQLEMVFPVYLIFTKCDLLNGFTDFFEDFTKDDREQMWGMTLPYKQQGDTDFGAIFVEKCTEFYETLRNQRVTALSMERKSDKKRNIYSFPLQFALAHKQLGEFVGMLFRTNPFQESPILRGVFLTSGTQEGFPIDQVVGAMSEAFGLAGETGGLMGGEGEKKSYFINHLFTKLIFPDQKLAQISSKVAKRKRFIRWGLGLSSIAGLALFSVALIFSFIANSALLATTAGAVSDVKKSEGKDLQTKLKAMDGLRLELEHLEKYDKEGPPIHMRFGLYRGSSILEDTRDLYQDHLHSLFLKRLKALLADELQKRLDAGGATEGNPVKVFWTELYNLTYTYQVLGGKKLEKDPADPNLVSNVLTEPRYNNFNTLKKGEGKKTSLWLEALGSATPLSNDEITLADEQKSFYIDHVDIVGGFNFNQSLVNQINRKLFDEYWIEEMYNTTVESSIRQNQPRKITLTDLVGTEENGRFFAPKLNEVLERQGYKAGEIPGIFIKDAWDNYAKSKFSKLAERVMTRMKLFGYAGNLTSADVLKTLKQSYKDSIVQYWHRFFSSIHLKPFENASQARKFLKTLTGTESPLRALFTRSWEFMVVNIDGEKWNEARTGSGTDDVKLWWKDINIGYKPIKVWLSNFDGSHNGKFTKLIDAVKPPLVELKTKLREANDKLENLEIYADTKLSELVKRILKEPITQTLVLLSKMARNEMNALWDELVYEPFSTKQKDRYPFARKTENKDVPWNQFAQLFGSDHANFFKVDYYVGILDKFQFLDVDLLTVSGGFDKAKKKALEFKKLYPKEKDPAKQTPLQVSFRLQFQRANAQAINFTLGDYSAAGLQVDKTPILTWEQGQVMRLSAVPTGGSAKSFYPLPEKGDSENSPWALFRFLDGGGFQVITSTKFQLTWELTTNDDLKIILLDPEAQGCFQEDFFDFNPPKTVAD